MPYKSYQSIGIRTICFGGGEAFQKQEQPNKYMFLSQ